MSRTDWIYLAYLVTIVCFIVALQFLSHPARARYGNWIGAVGMAGSRIGSGIASMVGRC